MFPGCTLPSYPLHSLLFPYRVAIRVRESAEELDPVAIPMPDLDQPASLDAPQGV